jgi:anti-sigma-K factor RskA
MTDPTLSDGDRLDLAEVYALDALSDAERGQVDAAVAAASAAESAEFTRRVREARETMAELSAATATEPPERLRSGILAAIAADRPDAAAPPIDLAARRSRRRLRTVVLAAAAAVVIAVGGGVVATRLLTDEPAPTAEQVLAADDVRTSSGAIEGGGTATVVYSKDADAGVLVMNNVTPPTEGTVYQMWLVGRDNAMTPAGTMDATAVAPSTTAVLNGISGATALAFTVEPPGGSTQPTGQPFAQLPLT